MKEEMVRVDASTLPAAAKIHAESWRESHAGFCRAEFVAQHTAARQQAFLQDELRAGKELYMLISAEPVGIVSVKDDLIENLYVLPAAQRRGYGTRLLFFALERCRRPARLWILENNRRAYAFYTRHGFRPTGNRHPLTPTLAEVEMSLGGEVRPT